MAVTLLTYGEQLLEVQSAISAVMNSQEYELGGRRLRKADLQFLQKREEAVQANLDRFGDVLPNTTARTGMGYGVSFG